MPCGDLTIEDRQALERAGFTVYENGIGFSNPFWQAEGPASDFTMYQVVRLTAESAEDARAQVVEALGRAPEGLRVEG